MLTTPMDKATMTKTCEKDVMYQLKHSTNVPYFSNCKCEKQQQKKRKKNGAK